MLTEIPRFIGKMLKLYGENKTYKRVDSLYFIFQKAFCLFEIVLFFHTGNVIF